MATNNALNAPIPFASSKGGTGVQSPTAHGIMVAQGANPMNSIVLDNGEFLIGVTGSDPVAATLTAGLGIAIDNSTPGVVKIDATSSYNWIKVTGTSQTMVGETAYVSTNASPCTFTLPATANFGDTFKILAASSGGFEIVPNTSTQQIRFGTAVTTLDTGSLSSTQIGDAIDIVCIDDSVPGSEMFMLSTAPVGNPNVN